MIRHYLLTRCLADSENDTEAFVNRCWQETYHEETDSWIPMTRRLWKVTLLAFCFFNILSSLWRKLEWTFHENIFTKYLIDFKWGARLSTELQINENRVFVLFTRTNKPMTPNIYITYIASLITTNTHCSIALIFQLNSKP